MIFTSADEFLAAGQKVDAGTTSRSSERAVLRAAMVVTPAGFQISEESARDNRYMQVGSSVDQERALRQHQDVVTTLNRLGVPVLVFPGVVGLEDGVYPNNVFATIPRRLIIGSMRHEVRRAEAQRADIRELFTKSFGYEVVDLSLQSCVAELTGPLVLDRARGLGICGMTERVDEAGCELMSRAFQLRATWRVPLTSSEYHTNLVLAVLAGRGSVVYPQAFENDDVAAVLSELYDGRVLQLDEAEKESFAANCLAITARDVLMSATATDALRPQSRRQIEAWGFRVHSVAIDELEKGGGSLRCLIAEVF